MPRSIEEIHDALIRIHSVAIGKSDSAYMSIPPDRDRDADFILSDAIKELGELRTANAALREQQQRLDRGNAALRAENAALIEQQAVNVANEQRWRDLARTAAQAANIPTEDAIRIGLEGMARRLLEDCGGEGRMENELGQRAIDEWRRMKNELARLKATPLPPGDSAQPPTATVAEQEPIPEPISYPMTAGELASAIEAAKNTRGEAMYSRRLLAAAVFHLDREIQSLRVTMQDAATKLRQTIAAIPTSHPDAQRLYAIADRLDAGHAAKPKPESTPSPVLVAAVDAALFEYSHQDCCYREIHSRFREILLRHLSAVTLPEQAAEREGEVRKLLWIRFVPSGRIREIRYETPLPDDSTEWHFGEFRGVPYVPAKPETATPEPYPPRDLGVLREFARQMDDLRRPGWAEEVRRAADELERLREGKGTI